MHTEITNAFKVEIPHPQLLATKIMQICSKEPNFLEQSGNEGNDIWGIVIGKLPLIPNNDISRSIVTRVLGSSNGGFSNGNGPRLLLWTRYELGAKQFIGKELQEELVETLDALYTLVKIVPESRLPLSRSLWVGIEDIHWKLDLGFVSANSAVVCYERLAKGNISLVWGEYYAKMANQSRRGINPSVVTLELAEAETNKSFSGIRIRNEQSIRGIMEQTRMLTQTVGRILVPDVGIDPQINQSAVLRWNL